MEKKKKFAPAFYTRDPTSHNDVAGPGSSHSEKKVPILKKGEIASLWRWTLSPAGLKQEDCQTA